jgi:hypothetical protein
VLFVPFLRLSFGDKELAASGFCNKSSVQPTAILAGQTLPQKP